MSNKNEHITPPSATSPSDTDALQSFLASDPVVNKKGDIKPHRLPRRTRHLILTGAGVCLLIAALILVSLPGADPADTDANANGGANGLSEEAPTIVLLDKTASADSEAPDDVPDVKPSQLQQVDITNKDEQYTIRYDRDTAAYCIDNYTDIDLDSGMLTALRTYTEKIAALKEVEDASNLEAFGLADPQATADITYEDGTTAHLSVGDQTPSGTGYYGQFGNDESVYIFPADALAMFRFRSTAFVSTLLVSSPSVKNDDQYGQALLKEITYSGRAYPTPLTIRRSFISDIDEMTYFSYIISSPYLRGTTDTVSQLLGSLKSVSATQALLLHPTDEQKEKLGFTDPLMQLELTMAVETEEEDGEDDAEKKPSIYYNSVNYRLTVAKADEDGYTVMVSGIDAVFLIDTDAYPFLFERTYENSVNEFLFYKDITALGQVTIQTGDQVNDFVLTHHAEKEDSDDKLTVTLNGKTLPTSDFRKLYELMMSLERYGVPDHEPGDENVPLIMTLYDTKGKLYMSVEYFSTSGSLCTARTSEGELFTTRWSDVSHFIQQIGRYVRGEEVVLPN